MPPIVSASLSGTLKPGVIAEFNRSFDNRWRERPPYVAKLFHEIPSTRLQETHAGFESAPKVVRWARGDTRVEDAFNEFFVVINNLSWNLWISWHEEDEEDDQTQKLLQRARDGATRFVQLDERIAIQLLTGTANPDLLPDATPNSYDGSNLFINTTRFGVSTGNIVTGSGVTTASDIRSDFITAVSVMHRFQDTESEPFWTERDLDYSNMLVVFNPANLEVFQDAFKADVIPAAPLLHAPLTNIVSRNQPQLWPTQRITDDDWYIVNVGTDLRVFTKQLRRPLRQLDQNPTNSDLARKTKELGVGWDARYGYGLWEPRTAVKVDN